MDWYLIFKFLHVACAIGWAGGGLAIIVLGIRAERAKDDVGIVQVFRDGVYVVPRVLLPSSMGAVVAGVVTVILGQSWNQLWIIVGIVGFLVTFTFGNFYIKPLGDQMIAIADKEGPTSAAAARCRKMLALIKFDAVLMFTIVADMVLKPQVGDWLTLAIMVLVVLGAAIVFLRPKTASA